MTAKRFILFIVLIGALLLVTPVSAKVITTKVDDKHLVDTYGTSRTIHTVDFGDILVRDTDYNRIMINDTITFDTNRHFGGYWSIQKVNGEVMIE